MSPGNEPGKHARDGSDVCEHASECVCVCEQRALNRPAQLSQIWRSACGGGREAPSVERASRPAAIPGIPSLGPRRQCVCTRGFVFHRYKVVLLLVDPRVRRPAAPDHGVRATARAPSRTPLSQSASALLNVKVCNCGNEVHQNGASADTLLPSSILQQLVHLSLMLHACREWLYRQVSLLSGCLSRGSSTAARVLRQCRAMTRW